MRRQAWGDLGCFSLRHAQQHVYSCAGWAISVSGGSEGHLGLFRRPGAICGVPNKDVLFSFAVTVGVISVRAFDNPILLKALDDGADARMVDLKELPKEFLR